MGLETLAIIGAVTAVVGTGVQVFSSIQAAKADKKAAKEQEKRRRLEVRRQRRRQLREERIRRGAAVNAGVQATGGLGSSGIQGGLASLQSQVGTNLGFSTQDDGLARNVFGFRQDAARARGIAQIGGGLASIGSSLFSAGGGFSGLGIGGNSDSTPGRGGGLPA